MNRQTKGKRARARRHRQPPIPDASDSAALKPTHPDLRERWLLVQSELRCNRLLDDARKLSPDDFAMMWPEQWLREVESAEEHKLITGDASPITAAQAQEMKDQKMKEGRRQFHWLTPEHQGIVRSELLQLHKSIADARKPGRPRKDDERRRVRELMAQGKSWAQIQGTMNREKNQAKSKDAYRALVRPPKE